MKNMAASSHRASSVNSRHLGHTVKTFKQISIVQLLGFLHQQIHMQAFLLLDFQNVNMFFFYPAQWKQG